MGSPGTAIFTGRIRYEEFNSLLENEKGFGRASTQGIFDKMRRTDPAIARSLKLLKLPIRAAKWIFEPADDTDEAKEHADFLTYNLFEQNNWDDLLRQSLLFYDFGFSILEVMEDTRDVSRARFPGLKGGSVKPSGRPAKDATIQAVVWSSIEPRLPKTIYRWQAKPDAPTQVDAVQQMLLVDDNNTDVFQTIPGDRILRFTHDQEGGNFQGMSVLRTAYKPWMILDQLERLDAIRHERQNVGIPVIELPAGADDAAEDKADEILSHLSSHEQGYVTLPSGWKLSWLTTTKGEGTDVNEAIERCKRDIADNVLAGFMTLGNGDTGSYALAETQADQYLLNIEAGTRYIEETWNKGNDGVSHVKRLIDLNYGPQEKYPALKATNLKSRDYGQIIPLVGELIRFGAIKPSNELENFLRSRLDLPANIVDAEEDLESKDSPAEEAKEEKEAGAPPPGPSSTSGTSAPGTPTPSVPGIGGPNG